MGTMVQDTEYFVAGEGTPVVLLHSSMSSKEQWLRLCQTLQEQNRVIAIDLYGYGSAPFPCNPETFSLLEEAERIDRIVCNLVGNSQFHLVGHSYGGATALRYTYANKTRIRSLVIFEPVAFHLLDPGSAVLAGIIDIAGQVKSAVGCNNYSEATRLFIDYWSGSGTYRGLSDSKKRSLDACIAKVVLDFQAGISDPLTLDDYDSITTPVCLITGTRSREATRQITRNLADTLARAQLHSVDGAHMAPVSHAEIVNPIITRFIHAAENVQDQWS